jgi:RNA polymerase sigma-54 factor
VKLGLSQSARLEQRLVQSPQMIQAMQILQLSSLDLQDRIQQELVENPFLEVADPDAPDAREKEEGAAESEAGEASTSEGSAPEPEPETDADAGGVETMLEDLERYASDYSDGFRTRAAGGEEGDKKMEAMANTPDVEKTLAEALVEELSFLELDARRRRLCEYLIYSLDERGYLDSPLEEIARECSQPDEPEVTVAELEAALADLRSISHPAMGARDIKESLLLQIDALGLDQPLLRSIVTDHLEDLEHNRLPRISKATGRSIEAIKQAVETLKTLDPHPGADYGEARAAVITPDVIVEEIDGNFEVRLDRQRTPQLTLSPAYREFLRQAQKGDGVREWVKKRLEAARWFIEAIHQRQSTLQRIAEAIFTRQRGFLERGVSGFKPLRMQEVADEVGVHISTVSRAVSGKYAQTPRGIYPLKYFFTGGTQKSSGEVASQVSIKQRIADLVAQEEPSRPLSDEELAALLEEKDNVRIARRTVTKYRKALNIPSSNQRKQF